MMRLFADGGFSLKDVAGAGRNDSRRTFVESRLNYARKLRERFLGGAARYLLHDQDSAGIEKLERTLTDMIDDALRFSCRLWTRVAPLRLHTWKDLANKEFISSNQLVTLCHAQAPDAGVSKHEAEKSKGKPAGPPREEGGRSIVMVVQPAVVTDNVNLQGGDASKPGVALVWLRGRVMVAGPMSHDAPESPPAGVGSQPNSPPLDTLPGKEPGKAATARTSVATPKPGTPSALEVLPAVSYKVSGDKPAS